jgi:protein SSD1
LGIYWSDRDVIAWLAENSDDEHLKKVHRTAEQTAANMEVASRNVHDENALFDEDEDDDDDDDDDEIVIGRTSARESPEAPPVVETSRQRLLSMAKVEPVFEGLKTSAAGHRIQEIKELMSVPVRIFYYSSHPVLTANAETIRLSSRLISPRAHRSSRSTASTPSPE